CRIRVEGDHVLAGGRHSHSRLHPHRRASGREPGRDEHHQRSEANRCGVASHRASRLSVGQREESAMAGVLEGIPGLDFGCYIARPHCAPLLAGPGAAGVPIRKVKGRAGAYQAPVASTGEGALFLQMNRNKLGMTLDPMLPEGQEVVRKLAATADVVVANLPPQTLRDMQLDYASLTAVKPDIILTTVTAYGRGG